MTEKHIRPSIRRFIVNLLFDVFSVLVSSVIVSLIKYGDKFSQVILFFKHISCYFLILLVLSVIFNKYEYKLRLGFYKLFGKYLLVWFFSSVLFTIGIVVFASNSFTWKYLLFGFAFVFFAEVMVLLIRMAFRYAQAVEERREFAHIELVNQAYNNDSRQVISDFPYSKLSDEEIVPTEDLHIIYEESLRKFIQKYSSGGNISRLLVSTRRRFNILSQPDSHFNQIVNMRKINYVQYLNKFFEAVNIKLIQGGVFVMCVETLSLRKKHHLIFRIFILGYIFRLFDYSVHRLWPRLPYVRVIYYWIWRKSNKRISYAEVLGRLYSCGFEYVDETEERGLKFFAVRKVGKPAMDYNVTYGPLISLRRIGKNRKIIRVYKLRTMHPYSEFLQEFVYQRNSLESGGKFKNDFRVTTAGKIMRKLWLDELPMLMNFFKGEMKLVGVRPLSQHYFNLYPEDLQELRTKYKPGLIPPFYVDMPKSLEEIFESERKYLNAYARCGFATDVKYFFKAMCNIVFKGARSK